MTKKSLVVMVTFSLFLLAASRARENAAVFHKSEGRIGSGAAPANTLVSFHKPDGLILSEGNIYFTSHDASLATVWRNAQCWSPGHESGIYCEAGARIGGIRL